MKRVAFFYLLFSFISIFCFTQNSFRNFRFRHLGIEDGLSSSSVYNIIQDKNGFIWIATDNGLNRYDGYHFKTFINDPADSTSISGNVMAGINSMAEDNEGNIWIGHRNGGIDVLDPSTEKFIHYKYNPKDTFSLSNDDIRTIIKDHSGNVWIGTARGLNCFDNKTKNFKRYYYYPESRADADAIWAMHADRKGKLWLATYRGGGLLAFDIEKKKYVARYVNDEKDSTSISQSYVVSITEDKNGILWIGTREAGLNSFDGKTGKFIRYKNVQNNFSSLSGNDLWSQMLVDKDNQLWIGTRNDGVNIFNREFNSFIRIQSNPDMPASITSNEVRCIFEDEAGLIWIGTRNGGIDIYDKRQEQFEVHQPIPNMAGSLSGKKIRGICEDKNGDLWVAMYSTGVDRWNPKRKEFIHYAYNPNDKFSISRNDVTGIAVDGNGTVWVSSFGANVCLDTFDYSQNKFVRASASFWLQGLYSDNKGVLWILRNDPGISIYVPAEKQFTEYPADKNDSTKLGRGIVNSIAEDKNGIIWLGSGDGLYSFNKLTRIFTRYKNNPSDTNSLSNNSIFALTYSNDTLWIATDDGLDAFLPANKKFIHFKKELFGISTVISSIAEDSNYYLWLASSSGLMKFYPRTKHIQQYDASDGLPTNEFSGAFWRGKEGKFYFGTVNGLLSFHPEKIQNNLHKPKIAVTKFSVLNKQWELPQEISFTKEISLTYREYFFSFEFSAFDFSAPEKNEYAYKMEGFNKDWVYLGNKHEVTFTNLDPGEYIFRIKSSNNHGVWNDEGTAVKIFISPPWWKTTWFRICLGLVVIGSVIFYIKWRERKLRKEKKILEEKVDQRTYELRKEKERSEELLLNILPSETAEELKRYGKTTPKNYDTVTVLFTDFKGFTAIAEKMSAENLVAELDYCFKNFDTIIAKYPIEKIKTIGDAYMCAGGLPVPNETNPLDVVKAGLDIQKFMQDYKVQREKEAKPFFEIRIGIHTGPIVAGIVGIKKFAYDIWGDTVNTASRMESSGEPGKVNISGTTYRALQSFPKTDTLEKMQFTFRGKISAKNKGEIEMYFVHNII